MKKNSAKPLILRDELHGDVSFDATVRKVIDHQYFQRLRYIKQLGLAEYVFPCATHTRFQHSLGAGYLAGQYFETIVRAWAHSPFGFFGKSGATLIKAEVTKECLREVAGDRHSFDFWFRVATLAGLLHDVGHGPWSHTYEYLELNQDFSSLTRCLGGALKEYFQGVEKSKVSLRHEDISVLYIFALLSELSEEDKFLEKYILPVGMLVNQKMIRGKFKKVFEKELSKLLNDYEVRGGIEAHRLLRPLISGPFDVDRIDYIQRDGNNCGVPIGTIEWRRIVSKLVPCLADHPNHTGEPTDVVLLSNMKNHHVLDDFIFSLFQMYTQVYMHPKIVGIEEIAKGLLKNRVGKKNNPMITFETHSRLSDEGFRMMLRDEFKLESVEELLLRTEEASFKVVSIPPDAEIEKELKQSGYRLVNAQDRPMMKDRAGVFLYSNLGKKWIVRPWEDVSAVAQKTFAIQYSPSIWIHSKLELSSHG